VVDLRILAVWHDTPAMLKKTPRASADTSCRFNDACNCRAADRQDWKPARPEFLRLWMLWANDFRDGEAIAKAVQHQTMKFVATKTVLRRRLWSLPA
jgi:hypothetical protein